MKMMIVATTVWLGAAAIAAAQRPGHTRQIEVLAFSPDGKTLVSGGHDGRIVFWDAVTGEPQEGSEGHRLTVSGLAFSGDGKLMATASWDGGSAPSNASASTPPEGPQPTHRAC